MSTHVPVVIVLGSETDKAAFEKSGMMDILRACKIGFEVRICSAHRNEEELGQYCTLKVKLGARVFIAIAGMAAALAGCITSKIKGCRPVLAVGLSGGSILADLAALLATTMVPKYTPVLTAGMDKHGLINAAISAIQILAVSNDELFVALQDYLIANTPEPKLLEF